MKTNLQKIKILIYGDSITWGRIAGEEKKFDEKTRYTKILANELGAKYEIIEEGLRKRMAKGDNPFKPDTDGFKQFPNIYTNNFPIDILIIFLGINDLNYKSKKTPRQISRDLESYLDLIKNLSKQNNSREPSQIVFISPPYIRESRLKNNSMFIGAKEKSKKLNSFVEDMTKRNNVLFFDSNKTISTCEKDGVHLDAENNIKLGKSLAEFIRRLEIRPKIS